MMMAVAIHCMYARASSSDQAPRSAATSSSYFISGLEASIGQMRHANTHRQREACHRFPGGIIYDQRYVRWHHRMHVGIDDGVGYTSQATQIGIDISARLNIRQ